VKAEAFTRIALHFLYFFLCSIFLGHVRRVLHTLFILILRTYSFFHVLLLFPAGLLAVSGLLATGAAK
jgi:hypothetical protein